MDLYSTIVREISSLANTHTPISDMAHKYNFQIIPITEDTSSVVGNKRTCFHAIKQEGKHLISITIETSENYRSFGDDKDPYTNTITISKDGDIIATQSYSYIE